jgi:hypothetical protein
MAEIKGKANDIVRLWFGVGRKFKSLRPDQIKSTGYGESGYPFFFSLSTFDFHRPYPPGTAIRSPSQKSKVEFFSVRFSVGISGTKPIPWL